LESSAEESFTGSGGGRPGRAGPSPGRAASRQGCRRRSAVPWRCGQRPPEGPRR
jgi:hypothetical protein